MFNHISMCCRPVPRLSEVFQDNTIFGGQTLKENLASFTCARQKTLDGLLESLENRFSDMDEGVLQSAQIASLQNWPDTDDTNGE